MTAAHDYIEDARLRALAAEAEVKRVIELFERGATDWIHVQQTRDTMTQARRAWYQARRDAGKSARP